MMTRTLTFTEIVDRETSKRSVTYNGKPECFFVPTQESSPRYTPSNTFGCHVVWCYYRGEKRVATVVFSWGCDEINTAAANRLRRCWPERIEFMSTNKRTDVQGVEWEVAGQAWFRDDTEAQMPPMDLEPYSSDEVFVHPDDNLRFDAAWHLTQKDRDWITECDTKRTDATKAEKCLVPGAVPVLTVPAEPQQMDEVTLSAIVPACAKLDENIRRPPSHLNVFLAAWKDGSTPYEMERREKWPRRTAAARLRNVEQKILNGRKVSSFIRNEAFLKNAEAQLQLARDHHVAKLHRPRLLDNTRAQDDEYDD